MGKKLYGMLIGAVGILGLGFMALNSPSGRKMVSEYRELYGYNTKKEKILTAEERVQLHDDLVEKRRGLLSEFKWSEASGLEDRIMELHDSNGLHDDFYWPEGFESRPEFYGFYTDLIRLLKVGFDEGRDFKELRSLYNHFISKAGANILQYRQILWDSEEGMEYVGPAFRMLVEDNLETYHYDFPREPGVRYMRWKKLCYERGIDKETGNPRKKLFDRHLTGKYKYMLRESVILIKLAKIAHEFKLGYGSLEAALSPMGEIFAKRPCPDLIERYYTCLDMYGFKDRVDMDYLRDFVLNVYGVDKFFEHKKEGIVESLRKSKLDTFNRDVRVGRANEHVRDLEILLGENHRYARRGRDILQDDWNDNKLTYMREHGERILSGEAFNENGPKVLHEMNVRILGQYYVDAPEEYQQILIEYEMEFLMEEMGVTEIKRDLKGLGKLYQFAKDYVKEHPVE